jgi:hypothetical protein
VRGDDMEDSDHEPATHEERMENYARRQAKALETLRNYAFGWTVATLIVAVVVLIRVLGA